MMRTESRNDKPEKSIYDAGDLDFLPISEDEKKKAIELALCRTDDFDLKEAVISRVSRHAVASPHKVAIFDDTRSVTYSQLVQEVRALALQLEPHLRDSKVVAVGGRRSADSIVAFLAVEQAGGIYLPIDANWPTLRIQDVLRRSSVCAVVVTGDIAGATSIVDGAADSGCSVIRFDVAVPSQASAPVDTVSALTPPPDTPRYVLYTSGSTGRPKGAVVEHQGMVNHLLAKVADLDLSADDCIAQTASLTFDISIWQMLVGLIVGGSVCIVDEQEAFAPDQLFRVVESRAVTILEVVPSLLTMLLDEHEKRGSSPLRSLRHMLATGEALPPSTVRRWISAIPTVSLVNAYGPTECSDDVTHEFVSLPSPGQAHTPIGGPISNVQLYVLVEEEGTYRSASSDEAGELFVGGVCVGRGYFGDLDRTKAALFRDPFRETVTGRLYRTGDVVRRVVDGTLEYLGRIDRQVKLSGIRIELGEIEETLRFDAAVASAAVVVTWLSRDGEPIRADDHDAPHERGHLVAFVSGESLDPKRLRDHAIDRLPRSMVPHEIIVLPDLPLTENKKVDYRKLEDLVAERLILSRRSDGDPNAGTILDHRALCAAAADRVPGRRVLHYGGSLTDVAFTSLLELAAGSAVVFPAQSRPGDGRSLWQQCDAYNVSDLVLSAAPEAMPDGERGLEHLERIVVDAHLSDIGEPLARTLAQGEASTRVTIRYTPPGSAASFSREIVPEPPPSTDARV
jgi:amino acid adenylation domain-containing protein